MATQKNPFTPAFGSEPMFLAGRERIIEDIIGGLENGPGDPNRASILVGPRGSGKTVLLTRIAFEASKMRLKDFLLTQPKVAVLIDDGENFLGLCKAKLADMEKLMPKAIELGIVFITTTLPTKMKGFEAIVKILRDTQAGLVLGNPSDQAFVQMPIIRNYKATPEIGFWYKRGDVRKIKLPFMG